MCDIIKDMWVAIKEAGGTPEMTGAEIIAQMWADIAEIDALERRDTMLRSIEAELVGVEGVEVEELKAESFSTTIHREWTQARAASKCA